MAFSPSIIRELPSDVIAKIKSSTSIVHLTSVILELVKNSLDANARSVFVTVDFKRGGCIVEDDGDGIPPVEFEVTGGLGKPHRMSPNLRIVILYGHRGMFLASLASLSLLTVTSRHILHGCTSSLILHHSTPVARLIPAPQHQVLRSASHGTSVTVNDLFGNMPVRVKSRALSLQRPDELEREWDYLRISLVSLFLANPRFSKLVLLDVERTKRMSIHLATTSVPEACTSYGQMEFDLKNIRLILTQSGLIAPQNLDAWHEISASVSNLIVRGAISLQPSPTRKCQFISLGKEPVLSRNSSNVFYNEVNRLFAASDFSKVAVMPDRSSVPHSASSTNQLDAPSNASTRSWANPINKWPMFYIRIDTNAVIQLDDDGSEHIPESAKSVQRIVDVLGAMVIEFLKQHNLRPRNDKQQTMSSRQIQGIRSKVSRAAGSSSGPLQQGRSLSSAEEAFSSRVKIPSFSRAQSLNSGQSFANWSRVKKAKDLKGHSPTHRTPQRSHAAPGVIQGDSFFVLAKHGPKRRNGQGCTNLPTPVNKMISSDGRGNAEDLPRDSTSDNMITWIDPHTELAYMINPRTGQTMNSRKSSATQRSPTDGVDTPSKDPVQTFWIENLLGAWDNPSFSRTEMPIPNLGAETAGQQGTISSSHDCFKGIGSLDAAQVAKYRGKLQRRALESAEVIAQVDKKFILAKFHTTPVNLNWEGQSDDVLLLIDQHAADERCRIELLFREMFLSTELGENLELGSRVHTVQVAPLAFEVSLTEGDLFQKYMALFSTWGIEYVTHAKTNSTVLITVDTLPVLIAERCRLEPRVLIDLMRREIWSSEEDGRKPFQSKKTFEAEDVDHDPGLSDSDDVVQKDPQHHLHHVHGFSR
ncbi:hypothetical protein N7445_001415 [Penicillium cf. griseofulvum]|nr:hypothetical protein N7445_001415 [Penicillium cf. griseofulvum]